MLSLKNSLRIKYSKDDKLAIGMAITELQHSKNKEISDYTKLEWVREFENLGFTSRNAIERINNAKYINTYGDVKFSDFIDNDFDELIPQDQIYKKAIELIKFHQDKFEELCVAIYGNRLIARAEKDKILELLTKNMLSENDLINYKKNTEWIESQNDKVNLMRKNLYENSEYFRNEVKTEIASILANENIPKESKASCISFAVETIAKKLNHYLFL